MSQTPSFLSPQVTAFRRFHLELVPDPHAALTTVCGGWERCARDYAIARPTFPYLAIEVVASGACEVELAGVWHLLRRGGCFVYGPGVEHRLRVVAQRLPKKYFIDFTGPEARRLLERAGLPPGTVAQLADPTLILARIDAVIAAGTRPGASVQAICDALLRAVLLTLADAATPATANGSRAHATYLRCRRWIEDRDGAIASLAEAATGCRVDPAYLCRLFQRFASETPYDLVRRLRVRRAADLLREPSRSVASIADELGFSNPFHFSRAFKRVFGLPPSAFRRGT
ncbi:MAG: helix-turn-helix transcriptional regulator [Planctomycetes bacterium]|nr:helix-turn-helix transcriptional regulator [Planctomycetota bacterium]